MTVAATVDATIISFDIVDHSLERDHARQYERIRGLNQIVRITLDRMRDGRTVWASAGDGGHVAFLDDDTLPEATRLVEHLRQWARVDGTPMRIACHRGQVSTLEGADGREQLVGNGINLCARLFQIDYADPQARRSLNALQPRNLTCGTPPTPIALLGLLPPAALARLLWSGELIERADGDFICQRNDGGDSMFIVLKGEIGVITGNETAPGDTAAPFDIRSGEGGIVGELALALSRPRTATLQAVGETALLAMNSDSLAERLAHEGSDSRLATTFKHFLEERIAEHLSRMASYLVLPSSREDLDTDPEPWERLFDGVRRIVVEADQAQSLRFGGRPDFSENGLYVLAGGRLAEISENGVVPKILEGTRFDIVFVRMPGFVMDVGHTFKIGAVGGERVTIIRLSEAALKKYARHHFQALVDNIRGRLSRQMYFDVFVSYAAENFELAQFWSDSFRDRQDFRSA